MEKSPVALGQDQLALTNSDLFSPVADSVICTDEAGHILLFNEAAEKSFGYSAAEVMGQLVEILLPPRYRATHGDQLKGFALEEGAATQFMGRQREVWGRRKSGEEFPAEAAISRHSVDGKKILTVVHRDITERKAMDQFHEAIEHELNHRIQNMLAVVNSLVSLSAKSASSVDDFRDSLQGRLNALAATQTLLRQGARGSVGVDDLLVSELSLFRNVDGTNLNIEAIPLELSGSAAQLLALAFHELATNSAKYGAFSDLQGHVTVTVEPISNAGEPMLAIEWRESGGPPVKPPSRQGFGTKLIEHVIKNTLRANIIVDYHHEGIVCRMVLPRSAVEAPDTQLRVSR